MTAASDYPLDPPLLVAGERIDTLEAAAPLMRTHYDPRPEANTEGILRLLESAQTPEQKAEAAAAFRGWVEATGLLDPAHASPSD